MEHSALKIVFYIFCLCFTNCAQTSLATSTPMKLNISDGAVVIEKSHTHDQVEGRNTANIQLTNWSGFQASEKDLKGKVWIEESSSFELANTQTPGCEVSVEKTGDEEPTALIKVKVADGIKGSPFETVINGENEGEVAFGDFPVRDWKAPKDWQINEEFISKWSYSASDNLYKIVKKMGDKQFLKKEIKVDPKLRSVSSVNYEILDAKMAPLARLTCDNAQ